MAKYSFDQLKQLWVQAGGSAAYATVAAAVAMAESGGNSDSVNSANSNGTVDRGLWQINSIHGSQSTLDPVANARAAVAISSGGTNWKPWCTAWSNGHCGGTFLGPGSPVLKFLPQGQTNTGVNATGGTGADANNAVLTVANPLQSEAAQVFWGSLSSLLGLTGLPEFMGQLGTKVKMTAYYLFLIVAGLATMAGGIILLILSTRTVQRVGQHFLFGGSDAPVVNVQVAPSPAPPPAQVSIFNPLPPEPVTAVPAPAAIAPQPLFPLDGPERRAKLGAGLDNMRAGLKPPPRVRPLRRKASVEYQPRHSTGD